MKHPFFFLAFVVLLLSVSPGEATHPSEAHVQEKVIFGSLNYPPYEMEKAKNGLRGFDFEVVTEAFRRMKSPFEVRFLPWKRALETAKTGILTGVFSCSPRDVFYMSDPISTATNALYIRKNFDIKKYEINKLEDLARYPQLSIGGVAGYATLKRLDAAGVSYDISPDDETVLKKLFAGRIDVYLSIKEFADYTLRNLKLSHLTKRITLNSKFYHVCFSKSWIGAEKLKERFNKTLKAMRKDGTYDSIHAKYR